VEDAEDFCLGDVAAVFPAAEAAAEMGAGAAQQWVRGELLEAGFDVVDLLE
jgi:hypothetical protein